MGFADIIRGIFKDIPVAGVLIERREFAEQQFAALDRDFAKLTLEKEKLEAENQNLRLQLQECAAQVKEYKVAAEKEKTKDRTEPEKKIMLLLRGGNELTAAEIGQQTATGTDMAEVRLGLLKDAEPEELVGCNQFAKFEYGDAQPATWYLTKFGKRYLAERGLLK
jgi:regulator of replication initiation timing